MNTPETTPAPAAFVQAYIEAALWASSATVSPEDLALPVFEDSGLDEGDDYNLDEYFGESDLAPETRETMERECAEFLAYCESIGIPGIPEYDGPQYGDEEKSGHDFWLTRNGHGCGYWDSGLGDLGDKLSDAAQTFGSADLYVGSDGLIYQS